MTSFRLYTEDGLTVGEFAVNSVAEVNEQTRGDTATLEIEFPQEFDLTVESGTTITIPSGESRAYGDITVNGTLISNGALFANSITVNDGGLYQSDGDDTIEENLVQDYTLFQTLAEFAGKYETEESQNATVKYREFIDTTAINSLVIGVEPSSNLQTKNITGIWGLLNDVSDARNQSLSTTRLTLEVDILAAFDEYSEVTDVQTTLEV